MTPAESALRGLYAARPEDLVGQLSDIADRIHAQLHELQRAPTAEKAERMAFELGGVQKHVLKLRESLLQPEGGRAIA